MNGDFTLVPYPWRRWLAAGRVMLAAGCLAVQWLDPGGSVFRQVAAGGYLVFALFSLAWSAKPRAALLMVNLLVDTLVFLLIADAGRLSGLVLDSFWIGYLEASALLLHGWRQIAGTGSAVAGYLALLQPAGWAPLLMVALPVIGIAALAETQRQSLEERLYSLSRQAVLYKSDAEGARTEERERIANDFHDGPLQAFMSARMRLEVVRRLLIKNQEAGLKELAQLQDLLQAQVAEMRAFLRGMRPSEVDASELIASLSRLATTFEKDSGLSVTFSGNASLSDQQGEVAGEILQLVRESLNNVRKHAQANAVAVSVEQSGADLHVSIDDNGVGFPFSGTFELEELEALRLGPASIKRRVRSLGGELTLESMPGRGSGLRIRIPQ